MKNLLLACCMILLDVIGCGPRHDEPDDYFQVTPNTVMLDSRGSGVTIEVESNTQWRISISGEQWLDVSPSSGNNDAVIRLTAQPNESIFDRSCRMFVIGGDVQREVRVYQAGRPDE